MLVIIIVAVEKYTISGEIVECTLKDISNISKNLLNFVQFNPILGKKVTGF